MDGRLAGRFQNAIKFTVDIDIVAFDLAFHTTVPFDKEFSGILHDDFTFDTGSEVSGPHQMKSAADFGTGAEKRKMLVLHIHGQLP